MAPLVKEALASSLQPSSLPITSSSFTTQANSNEAKEAINDFFTDNASSISGLSKEGLIFAYLADIDGRSQEISSNGGSEPSCLSITPTDVTFSAHTGHEITLKLSCIRAFGGNGDQSGTGSGLAYGRDNNYYYLYLMLVQQSNTNDKFGYAAKVHRQTNQVEVLFLERFVTYSRAKFFHLMALPDTQEFEFAMAGTSDGAGPASTQTAHILSPGTRLITNGVALKAEGAVAASTNSSGGTVSSFSFDANECLDVTNLNNTTSCGSLAFNFDLVNASALNATDINNSLKTMADLVSLGIATDSSGN